MHIKRIHEMEEKLTEIALCEINKGIECVNTAEMGAVIDMIKDLACAEKEAREAKEMQKEDEEDEAEEKYMLKMLKEEHGMSEEDGKRFYDAWRYKNGRFAPKGRGTRRGYEEPPYYHMMPDYRMDLGDYKGKTAEELRDMDRRTKGVMYYTEPVRTEGMKHDGMAKTRDRYADGYDDGTRKGYEDGYQDGEGKGKMKSGGSRYEMAKRGYEEVKEKHKGNTPEDKRMNMAEFEKVLNIVLDEIDDMLADAPPEMKNMAKTKGMARLQKIS